MSERPRKRSLLVKSMSWHLWNLMRPFLRISPKSGRSNAWIGRTINQSRIHSKPRRQVQYFTAVSYLTEFCSPQQSLTMKYTSKWHERMQRCYLKGNLFRFMMMYPLVCLFSMAWRLRTFSMFEQYISSLYY